VRSFVSVAVSCLDYASLFSKSPKYDRKQSKRKEEAADTEHGRHESYKEEGKQSYYQFNESHNYIFYFSLFVRWTFIFCSSILEASASASAISAKEFML
jgi:hypothetical protein